MNALKPLSLFSIALILTSCAGLPKFPAKYVYEVDLDNKVCGQYEVADSERLLFKHVADLPLDACNGVFGFSTDKIGPVIDWGVKAIKKGKTVCK